MRRIQTMWAVKDGFHVTDRSRAEEKRKTMMQFKVVLVVMGNRGSPIGVACAGI